jgi:tRNA pseudouridine38-40 synthase
MYMRWIRGSVCIAFSAPIRGARSLSVRPSVQEKALRRHDIAIQEPRATTALLKISYDGGRCTGWSAANDPDESSLLTASNNANRSLRRRQRCLTTADKQPPTGFVRSIQGIVQSCLSPLYGDLPVVVEGCSRTDKGVHARCLVAQFYCVDPDKIHLHTSSIPGKKQPYPRNSTDASCFLPLPTDLATIQYKLNRMLPWDVRVDDIAPLPTPPDQTALFHPTLSCASKTYEYTFSVGSVHDPTQWRSTWHIGDSDILDVSAMRTTCQEVFLGRHDFSAFQGAPRGKQDKEKRLGQDAVCHILGMHVKEDADRSWLNTHVYVVTVTGDRFLYKMIRFLVGALVAVGQHKLAIVDIERAMASGRRDDIGGFECAPAKGLVLADVDYDGIEIDWLSRKRIEKVA